MEFGIFDHLDNEQQTPLGQYYEERLKVIEMYDRLGFHSYHIAEHHATTLGMAPSPNVFLSAVAQRTKRLRFGPMVYALPLYHPLRLAQEICMVDQMSGGRLDMGFGRGSSPVEIAYFGVDPAETEAIFRRSLPRVLEAIETGVMHVEEQAEPYRDIVLKFTSVQKPTPRVWYGVHTPESADRAARRGWQTINLDMADEARECNDVFRPVWREAQPGRALPLMGLGRFIVVGETDDQALAVARRAYPHWLKGFTHLFRLLGRMQRHPRPDTWDMLHDQGKGIAGSPATVAAFLRDQLTTSRCNYCVGQFAFGDQTLPELQRSVSLFASDVMPLLRDLDVLADAA
jgi:alkanesulfonate monooxygenase SsuD/methylene tetrahydromethanopterin reductase-like flavin-dependent oxidoreductase (luciferase family)